MAMVAMRRQHQKGARPEACSGTDGGDTEAAATIATHQISTMAQGLFPAHDTHPKDKQS